MPETNTSRVDDSECKRILCSSVEATQTTDIYLTHNGIRKITRSEPERAKNAFLEATAKLHKSLDLSILKTDATGGPKLEALLETYCAECRAGWLSNWGHFDRLARYEAQYDELCGRSLESDSRTYGYAQEFASRISQFKNADDPRELEKFFVGLGQSKGFRYQIWIAAMAALAGDNDTLVHQLELNGSGVVFKYLDEVKFETPSEIGRRCLAHKLTTFCECLR